MSTAIKSVMAVWLLLMLSTAASTWWFSQPMFAPMVATIAVMLIAATKVSLVMAYFMELRNAPLAWRLAGTIWVLAALSSVMFLYLLSQPAAARF